MAMIIYLVLLSKIIVDQNKISISYTMLVSPKPKHLVFVCVMFLSYLSAIPEDFIFNFIFWY